MVIIVSTGRYTDYVREFAPMTRRRALRMLATLRANISTRTYELKEIEA